MLDAGRVGRRPSSLLFKTPRHAGPVHANSVSGLYWQMLCGKPSLVFVHRRPQQCQHGRCWWRLHPGRHATDDVWITIVSLEEPLFGYTSGPSLTYPRTSARICRVPEHLARYGLTCRIQSRVRRLRRAAERRCACGRRMREITSPDQKRRLACKGVRPRRLQWLLV